MKQRKSMRFSFSTIAALMLLGIIPVGQMGATTIADQDEDKEERGERSVREHLKPVVKLPGRYDVSAPLISASEPSTEPKEIRQTPKLPLPYARVERKRDGAVLDPVRQMESGVLEMPQPIVDFEGIGRTGWIPPDPNGDVSLDHYVQWVNASWAVWDKEGNRIFGPVQGNILWSGFGGPCEETNDGDPIVLYDELAGRWFMSQFALPRFPRGPFYQCIAVSQDSDPTGPWYRYEYKISDTKINDYPKFGVWPDAYYMGVNLFTERRFNWSGQGVAAFERQEMLQGGPARMIYYDLSDVNPNFGGMLPSDLDGPPPPQGTPNLFAQIDVPGTPYTEEADDDGCGSDEGELCLWAFHVDWDEPEESTFGLDGLPNHVLDTAPFLTDFGRACTRQLKCIPQPLVDRGYWVDAIADRLMYRLQFRDFDDYQTLVVNHTVNVGTVRRPHAGIRWYELRGTGEGWAINQQGTYAPDSDHRWMGSIAMDREGNMALGYSVSSTTTYPSIRYAGRMKDDPLGTLPREEITLKEGSGVQLSVLSRWGDYSMMAVDPADDCTFWYTQEYYETTSERGWQTRIGAFRFPGCGAE